MILLVQLMRTYNIKQNQISFTFIRRKNNRGWYNETNLLSFVHVQLSRH